MCDMIKPSFIPSPEIRQLRDLIHYRVKLTNMLTGEMNRTQNCLTISNLKLANVFSDVFGKSARSNINFILAHPGQAFDISPFADPVVSPLFLKSRLLLTGQSLPNRLSSFANALIESKKPLEFKEMYHRIKSRRDHKKANQRCLQDAPDRYPEHAE